MEACRSDVASSSHWSTYILVLVLNFLTETAANSLLNVLDCPLAAWPWRTSLHVMTGQFNPLPPTSLSRARRVTRFGSCRRVPWQMSLPPWPPLVSSDWFGPVCLGVQERKKKNPPKGQSQTALDPTTSLPSHVLDENLVHSGSDHGFITPSPLLLVLKSISWLPINGRPQFG